MPMHWILPLVVLTLAAGVLADDGVTSIQTSTGRPFVTYVDAQPGQDITAPLQAAIDRARQAQGGTVVLPPGQYTVSDTIHLAGTPDRFKQGGASGITLSGAGGATGTVLNYRGKPFTTILDMPAPWGCTVANLTLDADNTPGVVGIRYRGGYDRQTNGGKNNVFENMVIQRMDIGLWIGDPFGPDLVGSTFRSIIINYCRQCLLVEGANVTGMAFYNLTITNWNETGIKLIGHTARRIRSNEQDVIPPQELQDEPSVVRDAQTGREIFEKDIPPYALKHRTFTGKVGDHGPYLWAGGGSPDITLYNLNAHGKDPTTWAIDTNWANVRVYTARIEGPSGIFRRTSNMPAGRFADYLMDINATTPGNLQGNAIEYHGRGPLYLIGGTYEANIALNQETVVYDIGARFYERDNRPTTSALLKPETSLEGLAHIQRTGKTVTFPGRRGTYDLVTIQMPRDIGYRTLEAGGSPQVHRLPMQVTRTVSIPAGQTQVTVELAGFDKQPDSQYQLAITPLFNAGAWWVVGKRADGFTIAFTQPAPADARMDITLHRSAPAPHGRSSN